ncbi:transporter [Botryobacter ruber]|uniref:transporter n=1 Tax=Botryobacter ruber TaxID=2171629 RepID=UPI000E0BCF8F|nr:transporter [Botryobacter ruber]
MIKYVWLLVCGNLLFFCAGSAFAQQAEDKIQTDRPDQTEASSLVPKGNIQIETGYLVQKDRLQEQSIKTHNYPAANMRIGLLEWAEVHVLAAIKDSVFENGTRRRVSGVGPVVLGTKIKLWTGAGWRPEASFIARVTLPTGNKRMSPDKPEPQFRLLFTNELTEKLDLAYNLVYNRLEGVSLPAYTASASYELSDTFTCFAEVFGQKEKGEAAQHQADGGVLFFLLPNLQLDVALGWNLTKSAPYFFMTTGLSVRLPR